MTSYTFLQAINEPKDAHASQDLLMKGQQRYERLYSNLYTLEKERFCFSKLQNVIKKKQGEAKNPLSTNMSAKLKIDENLNYRVTK